MKKNVADSYHSKKCDNIFNQAKSTHKIAQPGPALRVAVTAFLVFFLSALANTKRVNAQENAHKKIIVQNYYYPKANKENEVYTWRLHASEVRAKLGLPRGRVLRKISGTMAAYVIWECEYSSLKDREADITKIDKSDEFKKVQEHMSTLIDKFERNVWEVDE